MTTDLTDLQHGPGLPGWPAGGDDGPVFAEPWQAQAFAMTLALHQRGLFTWPQWAQALSAQRHKTPPSGDTDPAPDDGRHYYHHWLAALEALVQTQQLSDAAELDRTARAWGEAAERTPHGQAIVLLPQDYPD